MKQIVLLLLLLGLSTHHVRAEVILSNKSPIGSGVKIVTGGWLAGGWSATDEKHRPVHADATYNAFIDERKQDQPNWKPQQGDFYYSLEIVPQFENKSHTNCSLEPTAASFFQSLFGTTTGGIIVVKADVQYRWTTGVEVDFLKNDAGLIVAAAGPSATQAQAGFGCYFDTTLRPTFPLLLYGGGGKYDQYDDFVVKFIVMGGKAKDLNLVSNVLALFGEISAAAGWASIVNGLAGPLSQHVQQASQSFQTALANAGNVHNQVSIGVTLRANGDPADSKLAISIPDLFKSDDPENGDLVVYVRRVGSIALANSGTNIWLSTVLDNAALASRQCTPLAIASGSCSANNSNDKKNSPTNNNNGSNSNNSTDNNTGNDAHFGLAAYPDARPTSADLEARGARLAFLSNGSPLVLAAAAEQPPANSTGDKKNGNSSNGNSSATIRGALLSILKPIDKTVGESDNPIAKLIDLSDTSRDKSKIYSLCLGIRTVANEYLHLSTLDEMMVRWAFTKEGGLQDALKQARAPGADAKLGADLATKTGASSVNELADKCWNDGDQQTLQGMMDRLGKTIVDEKPLP